MTQAHDIDREGVRLAGRALRVQHMHVRLLNEGAELSCRNSLAVGDNVERRRVRPASVATRRNHMAAGTGLLGKPLPGSDGPALWLSARSTDQGN